VADDRAPRQNARMWQLILKGLVSGAVIVAASEVAKRSTLWAAILVSLPLTSILALMWLYTETGSKQQVADLSTSIMWIVLPSMLFFVALPVALKSGLPFLAALAASIAVLAGGYAIYVWLLSKAGVTL
jgi:hypothetical protein